MAPPLEAIEGGTGILPPHRRRRRLRLSDGIERFSERLATAWRNTASAGAAKFSASLPSFRRQVPPSSDGRHIPLGARWQGAELRDQRTGKPYVSNFIRSNRYTLWDFLPRQLVFQFMKIANFYFLIIAILQMIPGLSPVAKYTTGAPLIIFVSFSMGKEGYDDYRRYRLDKVENRSDAWVYDPNGIAKKRMSRSRKALTSGKGQKKRERLDDETGNATELRHMSRRSASMDDAWTRVQWQDVRVGDIVRLARDRQVPADMVLLSASGPSGIAYIDTMALDGETSLKSKQACPALAKRCGTVAGIASCDAVVVSEDPNLDIYSFDGRVTVGDETVPLTMNQVVFRGSTMRNTKEAYGLVVNSGEECKIRMNANKGTRAKIPAMQAITNRIILFVVFVLIMLAVGIKIGNDLFEADYGRTAWYMFGARLKVTEQIFGTIILLNTLVPISLYVSLEIVKIGQFWMMQDVEMYDPETNTPMVINTTSILENLGQVSYVFSDKTGTLTENIMRFQKMSAGGWVWHHDAGISDGAPEGELRTSDLLEHLQHKPNSPLSERALHFVLCTALCNTCLPETKDNGEIEFQAASPDELALVNAAREMGYTMVERDTETIKLRCEGADGKARTEVYGIMDVIEFTSDRKRMTVILRTPDNKILLLSKGADSALLPRLRLKQLAERVAASVSRRTSKRRSMQTEHATHDHASPTTPSGSGRRGAGLDVPMLPNADIFEACFRHIEEFASDGLRTLLFAYRYVDEAEYRSWKREYLEAETSLTDRHARIDEVAGRMEVELELSGITAIEDKLQRGVPETIDKLRRANVKVWMLTGDKRETAINIGHSAKICHPFSDLFVLDAADDGDVKDTIEGVLQEVGQGAVRHSVVVIDGLTLTAVEQDGPCKKLFYLLLTRVDAVICCRASPAQKADLVRSIRDQVPGSLTLAVGDGANDISMILAAHVGVGISGREGLQAARVSDYSVAQFRFLQRLLLVHGRWNYVRTSKYVLGTFWKEMVFYMNQAAFQGRDGYTGTSLYESASLTVFNVLFTSLAVILVGIFEQDLSAETLLAIPELYTYGQHDRGINFVKYLGWVALAAAEAMVIFFSIRGVYTVAYSDEDTGLFAIGNVAFSVCVIFINVKMLLIEMRHKTVVVFGGFLVTVAGWWVWNLILAGVYKETVGPYVVRGSFIHGFGDTAVWWLAVLAALAAAVVLELAVKSVRRVYFPNDTVIMQELERQQSKKEAAAAARKGRRGDGAVREDEIEGQELQEQSRRRHGFGGGNGKPPR